MSHDGKLHLGYYLFVAAGLVLALAGIVLMVVAWQVIGQAEADRGVSVQLCLQRLRAIGVAERVGPHLRLVVPKISNPLARIEDASAVPSACPGWSLYYFCIGSACGEGSEARMIVELAPQ